MRPNRSIPSAVVIPVLIYPDVREAVAWLNTAFGFVERLRIGENHRSQLSIGEGAVIVGDVRNERRPPRGFRNVPRAPQSPLGRSSSHARREAKRCKRGTSPRAYSSRANCAILTGDPQSWRRRPWASLSDIAPSG